MVYKTSTLVYYLRKGAGSVRPRKQLSPRGRPGRKSHMFDAAVLKGKRILITGGGTGLGKEMAVGFAAHGASVYICGRRQQVLDQAVQEIRDRSGGQAT